MARLAQLVTADLEEEQGNVSMKFVFTDNLGGRTLSLRSSWIEAAVRQHLNLSGADLVDASAIEEPDDLKAITRVSYFPSKRKPETTVFMGLPSNAANMTERNVLLCSRPLAEELKDFENRHSVSSTKPALWPIDVLSAFDSVVFLDRFALLSSSGFAPWIKFRMAENIVSPQRNSKPQIKGVLLIEHDKTSGGINTTQLEQGLCDLCPIYRINDQSSEEDFTTALSQSSLHLHCGWSARLATVALAPLDSFARGTNTIVLTSKPQSASAIGGRLLGKIEERGYAAITDEPDDALTQGRQMLHTFDRYRLPPFKLNPEVAASANKNAQLIQDGFQRLKKEVLL